jgi:hypothetical protein
MLLALLKGGDPAETNEELQIQLQFTISRSSIVLVIRFLVGYQ